MANGLSKKTNLQGDIAKKQAVKMGSAPFSRNIGDNHKGLGSHPAAGAPGGKLSPQKLAGVGKKKSK